jgi:putative DNA primase/helicase
LIELKAEGGYCIVPPSPRPCHPRNQLYRILDGSPPLTEVPVITPDERNMLLEEARSFNRWNEPEPKRVSSIARTRGPKGNRPGDDFDRKVTWADILEPHGWVMVGQRGETEDWRRPGKSEGNSATVNYGDRGWFHVFSSNADPFDDGRSYSKFTAYALLYHGGDFKKAAKALQQDGFGPKLLPAGKRTVSGGIQTIKLGGIN